MVEKKKRKRIVDKKEWRRLHEAPYSIEELKSYYTAMRSVYSTLLSMHPDAIIAPLRGAFPLARTVQFFANLERRSSQLPQFYFPRTGELTAPTDQVVFDKQPMNFVQSISTARRIRDFTMILKNVLHKTKKRPVTVVLLDEVFEGGSISNTLSLLKDIISSKKMPVRFTAMAIASQERQKCPAYRAFVSKKEIKEFKVERLFTIDNPLFIHPIIERSGRELPAGAVELLKRMPKEMRGLARIYVPFLLADSPTIGMSKKALYGRLALFDDLAELQSRTKSVRLRRLPTNKQLSRFRKK